MKVWILTKRDYFGAYNNLRFKEVAKEKGIDLSFVAPEDFDIIVTKEGKKSIRCNGEYVNLPDCLIPRMGSGTTYFALAVIRHLESQGVFVLNSAESVESAKDKLAALQKLATHNIPIPKTILAKFPLNIDIVKEELSYPVIIKTISGSQGKGVFLCENKSKLQDVIGLVEESKSSRINIILQEFIRSSKGRDLRVIVIGGRPYGAMLRTAKRGKFKANFSTGGNVAKFELNQDIEWLAVECAKIIGLEVAGVDILFDGDKYLVCEVNSAPGFQGFEKATGLDVPSAIFEFIKLRLEGSSQNPNI